MPTARSTGITGTTGRRIVTTNGTGIGEELAPVSGSKFRVQSAECREERTADKRRRTQIRQKTGTNHRDTETLRRQRESRRRVVLNSLFSLSPLFSVSQCLCG
jgi:hypothetical protein